MAPTPAVSLVPATLPAPRPEPTSDIATDFQNWLSAFSSYLTTGSPSLSGLLHPDCYWRDHLCFSFENRTVHTASKIGSVFLDTRKLVSFTLTASPSLSYIDFEQQIPAIAAVVDVKTTLGAGRGVVRLIQDLEDGGKWKAYTVFTALMSLDKIPERVGRERPIGVKHGEDTKRMNWRERRERERLFLDEEPMVVIIGGGQGGLVTAARLKRLGIPTLVVDKNERIGDNWRKRYRHLVLHDPVQYDHLPYLPFPASWPTYTPKDKLADWFETYASALELNVWTSSTISSSVWNPSTSTWTLQIGDRTLHPRHVVIATGASGEPHMPTIPGMSNFAGSRLCHSSAFPGAPEDGNGRKAVVVGCCNSGHDIAQDYYEKGWDVTIVQRSSTYVMSTKNGLKMLMKGLYEEDGPPTEDADLLFMSFPLAILKRNQISLSKVIHELDGEINTGLAAAGFKFDLGTYESGFLMKYLECGGGYYLDVGASRLIAERKIKLKQGSEPAEVLKDGVRFTDGEVLPAEEIIFATGYGNMRGTAEKILGKDALEGVGDMWGIDMETAEIRGLYKKVGGKGLWFVGGNLAFTRWHSRGLALGIAADLMGLA